MYVYVHLRIDSIQLNRQLEQKITICIENHPQKLRRAKGKKELYLSHSLARHQIQFILKCLYATSSIILGFISKLHLKCNIEICSFT